jgi:4-hydroxy-tetrahydrodipicolinate synthase
MDVVARTVKTARGRVKVMAGTGSNATAEAIKYTKHAEKVGADAALVVAPYYNKPTQEGLYQHFKAVAESTSLPIFIYNIPGRSVVNMTDATLARLAEINNIAGVKDATGDLARVATLRHLVGDRLVQFSGEDMTAVGFNAMGGRGVISVVSNVAPKLTAHIQELTRAQKYHEARDAQAKLVALTQLMFVETNPIPVKYAMSLLGKCSGALRLPLVSATPETQAAIKAEMTALQLI